MKTLPSLFYTKEQYKIFPLITEREKEVLILIAYEKTSKEIADALFISLHTALSHRKKLLQKLNAKNTAGLVRRGFEMGLLTLKNSSIETKKP